MKSDKDKKVSYVDIVSMPDSDEKWKLAKENGYKSIKPPVKTTPVAKSWNMKLPDEKQVIKYVKGDPESKGKSELEIEKEILTYLRCKHIEHFQTKVKGEIQSIGNGRAILKKATNPGFPDIVAIISGKFVAIEVKRCGGVQSQDQINMQIRIKSAGGLYLLVTSVRELISGLHESKMPDFYF